MTISKTVLAVLVVALLAIGFGLGVYGTAKSPSLGATAYDALHQVGDIYQGMADTKIFTGGVFVGTTKVGNGTLVSKFSCASATWNPGSVASSGSTVGGYVTSTDIALTGAVMGDQCSSSLTSATSSGLSTDCTITNTATATIALYNISGAAIDPATGTAKVCYSH